MIINDMIKYENQTIKWIATEFNNGNLYVDDSFQRRYVWLKKHQIRLIETILMGYVIPEIYIWKVGTNPDTGDTKFSIVDGQQRIGAIVSFLNGDFNGNRTITPIVYNDNLISTNTNSAINTTVSISLNFTFSSFSLIIFTKLRQKATSKTFIPISTGVVT
jgi:uncharacterized protein with ParB-like and HNH nuclease domain